MFIGTFCSLCSLAFIFGRSGTFFQIYSIVVNPTQNFPTFTHTFSFPAHLTNFDQFSTLLTNVAQLCSFYRWFLFFPDVSHFYNFGPLFLLFTYFVSIWHNFFTLLSIFSHLFQTLLTFAYFTHFYWLLPIFGQFSSVLP